MMNLPPSGVWRGETAHFSPSREGACGGEAAVRGEPLEPLAAVLFFDEECLLGNVLDQKRSVKWSGWWGPSAALRPPIWDLFEAGLWERGEIALQIRSFTRDGEETIIAWLHENEISGYSRFDGP